MLLLSAPPPPLCGSIRRSLPISQCRGVLRAVTFPSYGSSQAECASTGSNTDIGSSREVPHRKKHRKGVYCTVGKVAHKGEHYYATATLLNRSIATNSNTSIDSFCTTRHATRVPTVDSVRASGVPLATRWTPVAPTQTRVAFNTSVASYYSRGCCEPFTYIWSMSIQSRRATARAAAIDAATMYAVESNGGGLMPQGGIVNHPLLTKGSPCRGLGTMIVVTEQLKKKMGKLSVEATTQHTPTAAGITTPILAVDIIRHMQAANITRHALAADTMQYQSALGIKRHFLANPLISLDEQQCCSFSRVRGGNAERSGAKDRKPLESTGINATRDGALLRKPFRIFQAATVSTFGWGIAACTLQARAAAYCCHVQQRASTRKAVGAAAVLYTTFSRSYAVAPRAGGRWSMKLAPLSVSPFLFNKRSLSQNAKLTASISASNSMRRRCMCTALGETEEGSMLFNATFVKSFTTSAGKPQERNDKDSVKYDRPSLPQESRHPAHESTEEQAASPTSNALPKDEAAPQQEEETRGASQEQFVAQPVPRGQKLLGFLAVLGACISMMLLYERSLLGSAALLYGAWDAQWDASWRSSAEQYENELAAKALQPLPSSSAGTSGTVAEKRSPKTTRPPTRQIILVRHGQYHMGPTDEVRRLTDLGRRQAAATGRRLQELLEGQYIVAIVHSNLERARETAQIIQQSGGFMAVPLVEDPLLAEGTPAEPVPPPDTWPTPTDIAEDGLRIEKAFRRYFYRARCPHAPTTYSILSTSGSLSSSSGADHGPRLSSRDDAPATAAADAGTGASTERPVTRTDSFIILVGHGNVIRYFLMRALQLPACAWLRWALHNTGLTWISIDTKGRVSCRSFGDVGHLSTDMISYN